MANIYRDSIFTISALSSSGSTRGILASDTRVAPPPGNVAVRVALGESQVCDLRVARYQRQSENLNELTLRCPLYSRGWCLQEAVLSPRHLYYGREQIYWRCPSGFQDAEGCGPGRRFPHDAYSSISSVLFQEIFRRSALRHHHDTNAILNEYYLLVQDYSQRTFTFGTDKLPAFSGIAQRLQPVLRGAYLAGLWSTDICRSLSWCAENVSAKHARPYRAPSWSWAVTDDPIWFDVPREAPHDGAGSFNLKLLDHHIKLGHENNPWGEVEAGSLKVKGLTKHLSRSSQVVDAWPCSFSIGTAYFDDENVDDVVRKGRGKTTSMSMWSLFRMVGEEGIIAMITTRGSNDEWEIEEEAMHADSYLILLIYAELDEGEWAERPSGLILQHDGDLEADDNTYRRVGAVRLDALKASWLMGWKEQTLTLV